MSLAHDLGHTPFGHAGEDSLNECMEFFGGFDHNIQTLRVVTYLEQKYYNFRGLNLSLETLDGLVKHNGPVNDQTNYDKILGKNYFKNKISFNNSPSIEAQIASISDDIAYNSHDLEDGLRANLFQLDDLKFIPVLSEIIYKHKKNLIKKEKELVLREIVRDIINEMVKDIINNTKIILKKKKLKSIKDVYKTKTPIVCFSERMNKFDISVKSFLKEHMYLSKNVLQKANSGKKIIKELFYIS